MFPWLKNEAPVLTTCQGLLQTHSHAQCEVVAFLSAHWWLFLLTYIHLHIYTLIKLCDISINEGKPWASSLSFLYTVIREESSFNSTPSAPSLPSFMPLNSKSGISTEEAIFWASFAIDGAGMGFGAEKADSKKRQTCLCT